MNVTSGIFGEVTGVAIVAFLVLLAVIVGAIIGRAPSRTTPAGTGPGAWHRRSASGRSGTGQVSDLRHPDDGDGG